MNELDDGFGLSPDEEVQSLTVWLTSMGFSTECRGMEVGQLAAIYIGFLQCNISLSGLSLPSTPKAATAIPECC